MIAECYECGTQKRGCKIINWVCPDYEYMGKRISWKDRIGQPACRACLNFYRKLKVIYYNGKWLPFYDVIPASQNQPKNTGCFS